MPDEVSIIDINNLPEALYPAPGMITTIVDPVSGDAYKITYEKLKEILGILGLEGGIGIAMLTTEPGDNMTLYHAMGGPGTYTDFLVSAGTSMIVSTTDFAFNTSGFATNIVVFYKLATGFWEKRSLGIPGGITQENLDANYVSKEGIKAYNQAIKFSDGMYAEMLSGATISGKVVTIPSGQNGLNSFLRIPLPEGVQATLVGCTLQVIANVKATVNLSLATLRGYFQGLTATESEVLLSTDGTYNWYKFTVQIAVASSTAAIRFVLQKTDSALLAAAGTFELLETYYSIVSVPATSLGLIQSDIIDRKISAAVALSASKTVARKVGLNLLDPGRFRYGYYYTTTGDGTLQFANTYLYGCTDYIPVTSEGLVTTGAGTSAQGLAAYAVFDALKKFLRKVNNTNQYVFEAGDVYVVFVYRISGDMNFAKTKAVLAGSSYAFEAYDDYSPIAGLQEQINALNNNYSVSNIKNGTPVIYGDVSNFDGTTLVERHVDEDYLIYRKTNPGNTWIYSPVFYPTGSSLLVVRFSIEMTRTNPAKGMYIYLAMGSTIAAGKYLNLFTIAENGVYEFTIDTAYYSVYEEFTQFCIWFNNASLVSGESLEAKISNLQVFELTDGVSGVNISGDNAKVLFESVDQQLSQIKSQLSETSVLVAPNGNKYMLSVSSTGVLSAISIVPTKGKVFGNSLLTGFTAFGMAASGTGKDYYYLITEAIKTLNPSFTYSKQSGKTFEDLEVAANIDSTINSVFIANLVGDEDLVIIQLGDNINTSAKNAVFAESALKACKAIRLKCPNARVLWIGMWYGSPEKYAVLESACKQTGCQFVSIGDIPSALTRNEVGNLSQRGTATRTLSGIVSIVENTPTNITVNFSLSGTAYTTTLDVTSYSLSVDVLTYTSTYYIIPNKGEASHPNDLGFKRIANKYLYETGITDIKQFYPE